MGVTRYSRWWIVLWAVNVCVLAGLLIASTLPAVWLTAAVVLFGVPEFIGVRVSKDANPPLTQMIRHHVPRWVIFPVIGASCAWAVVVWWSRPHHVLITVLIAAIAAWGHDHFDVTYDNAPE
jgi:hypothetical protein